MKASIERRVQHLEERVAYKPPPEVFSRVEIARRTAWVLTAGGNAAEELDADDGSMDPKRREKLTEQVAAARGIAASLAKHSSAKQVETGEPAATGPWRRATRAR